MHNTEVDFIGVGAQKAGTSWVYACLYEHPEICAPVKEIHFFSRPRFEKGKEWYEAHFKNCAAGHTKGEFSTSYLYSSEAPNRIKKCYPDVRLIAILRNPIDRAYSHYRNAIKAGEIAKETSFEQFFCAEESCLKQGLYAEQLKRYLHCFKKEQLLVLIYEDSKKDPETFIRTIYSFLEVTPDFKPTMLHSEVNIARTPRWIVVDGVMHWVAEFLRKTGLDRIVWVIKKSGVTDAIRSINTDDSQQRETEYRTDELRKYYARDVVELGGLINRDMSAEWKI